MPVSANAAATNSDNEAFRYECLCCGEEVRLAAQDSKYTSTHFRHRSGNNDKECELYLGRHGLIPSPSAIKIKKQDRVDFYYDNLHKAFYISFCFNEIEISAYEKNSATIEVREYKTVKPFFSKQINHINFYEDVVESYMLEKYSTSYYISNTINNIKREYKIFSNNSPTFFKIQGYDINYKAKYIKSNSLYTNTKYFIAWPGQNTAQIYLRKVPGVEIDEVFQFRTMNNTAVWALVATFVEKNQLLDTLLQSWGYNLSVSEELTLLWPPAFEVDEISHVSANNVFLYSSFILQANGNTNLPTNCIHIIDSNVTKVDIKEKTRILKKNAEISIICSNTIHEPVTQNIEYSELSRFSVPEEGQYYLFSSFGTEKLFPGQVVFLTDNSSIFEYKASYISTVITNCIHKEKSIDEKIEDALSNYWVQIPYNEDIDQLYESESVERIIKSCQSKSIINKAVLKIIKEEKNE